MSCYCILFLYQLGLKMSDLNDYYITKRFKATLANFQSYCQRRLGNSQGKSSPSKDNVSLTKYRSIRELRKPSYTKKWSQISSSKKIEEEVEEDFSLQIKNNDIIEIIKLKLAQSKSQHIKTQGNESKNQFRKQRNLKRQVAESKQLLNKSSQLKNIIKRKKVALVVQNSKIKLSQSPYKKKQRKHEEFIVTLHTRPSSALVSSDQRSSLNLKTITSPYIVKGKLSQDEKKQIVKKQLIQSKQMVKPEKVKQISGWQNIVFEDDEDGLFQLASKFGKIKKKVNP